MQSVYCTEDKTERCFFGTAPTLSEVNTRYGRDTATTWLILQLNNLAEFYGFKDKLTTPQIEEIARIIASQYHYLKVTEVMVFFYRIKLGEHEKIYGKVAPKTILELFRSLLSYRLYIIERHEAQKRSKEREEWAKKAVTREEYLRMKAENGKNNILSPSTAISLQR